MGRTPIGPPIQVQFSEEAHLALCAAAEPFGQRLRSAVVRVAIGRLLDRPDGLDATVQTRKRNHATRPAFSKVMNMHLDEDLTARPDTLAQRVGVARGELIRNRGEPVLRRAVRDAAGRCTVRPRNRSQRGDIQRRSEPRPTDPAAPASGSCTPRGELTSCDNPQVTTTARRTLAGLAAVAIVLIAGGLLFDRHETQSYSECVNGPWMTFSVESDAPDASNDLVVDTVYAFGCEDANRAGLIAAGIGAAVLAASAIIWWRQRSAPSGAGGQ